MPIEPSGTAFDFIIVGGGTAGCILAERLSADGRHTVALLEAGGEARSPWTVVPAGFYKLLTNPSYNWNFRTEPEPATCMREIAVPRGKGLGGSTLINGMIYVRGQPQDYNRWAQRGCTGWGFDDVEPVFRRLETYVGPDPDDARGKDGPLPVCEVEERPAIAEAFISAGEAAGYRRNPDYNGVSQDGFGYYQVNQKSGRRVSAAAAWLAPARGRKNLAVLTDTFAVKLLLSEGRAAGVEVKRPGKAERLSARCEVILAAGAVQSPQLLELSGIGRPEVLKAAGIEPRHILSGVGENYLDHFCTRMNWRVSRPETLNEETRGWRLLRAVARYALARKGVLTFGTGLAHGFVRTREGLEGPDVQFFFMHASYANAAERKLDRFPGMTLGVTQLRPESRGTIHIVSPDPARQPAIRPNFLATAEDRRAMVEGMKIGRTVMEQAPMDAFRVREMSPGKDCVSEEDWLDFARRNGQTIYHTAGTCRMGGEADPECVVDARLRVRGIKGLRIIDASVMPEMVSGNTQAAVMMIADKGADLVLADTRG
ncbi:glucose-methanol-choline oxidoreductase [Nitratireductor indicus C115]|uniref:Glucose-methanol-choline oxidoreductase n=1 Tax=Nitratireductor indicus C115 TaxID=1231190 RepID=K2N9N2_9HYPH|nr:GMC family oxidoreductase N-terminal domain-containing protein [Nitratireductor indicus]EKF44268.1 glucose-methanol-choline oxidoreductase [Nitratireductor indicus C115]SFQ26467.1 Choline dehydrogenase [Nitratireductor indicus]